MGASVKKVVEMMLDAQEQLAQLVMIRNVSQDVMKIQIVQLIVYHATLATSMLINVLIQSAVLMMIVRVPGYVKIMNADQNVSLTMIVIPTNTVTLLRASVKKVAEMMLDVQEQIAQLVRIMSVLILSAV